MSGDDAAISAALLHPAVRQHLASLQARYEVLECDPDLADTAAFVAAYGVPLDRSANTIVVASKGAEPSYAACVLLATTALDVNAAVRRAMGVRKASFAAAGPVRSLTGMEIGGVTPFGLPADLPILVDARVVDAPWIVLGGGNRSSKLKVRPAILHGISQVRVIEGLALAR